MTEPFIAEIRLWACNFAPRNWAFCNGDLIQVEQNTALFALLGAIYGGNGRTDFAVPNLIGRAALHYGSSQGPGLSPHSLGQRAGSESHTLNVSHLPEHTHTVNADVVAEGDQNTPVGNYIADVYFGDSSDGTMAAGSISDVGTGEEVDNMQPWQALNFCIALDGIYPTQ